MNDRENFSSEFNIPKQQNIKIDVDQLLKKCLDGKNINVLFEGEIQKKLIEPLFKNINETIQKTSVDIKSVNISQILQETFEKIKIDVEPIRMLNAAFNSKVNNLTTTIASINIKGLQSGFEDSIVKQFKQLQSHAEDVTFDTPKKLKSKDLLNLVINSPKELSLWAQFKYSRITNTLLDKLADSVENFDVQVKGKLTSKDLLNIILNQTPDMGMWAKFKYNKLIDSSIDILTQGITQLTVKPTEPITTKDILNILFDKTPETAEAGRKKYQEILNNVLNKINNFGEIDLDDSDAVASKNKKDTFELDSSKEKGTVFTHKDIYIAADTLKQIQKDQLENFKLGDLLTNKNQYTYTQDIIRTIREEASNSSAEINKKDEPGLLDYVKDILAGAFIVGGGRELYDKFKQWRMSAGTEKAPTLIEPSKKEPLKERVIEIESRRITPEIKPENTLSILDEISKFSKYIKGATAASAVSMVMQPVTIAREDEFNDLQEISRIKSIKDKDKQNEENEIRKSLIADRAIKKYIDTNMPVDKFQEKYKESLAPEEIEKLNADQLKPRSNIQKILGPLTIEELGIPKSIRELAIKQYDTDLENYDNKKAEYLRTLNKPLILNDISVPAAAPIPAVSAVTNLPSEITAAPLNRSSSINSDVIASTSPDVDFTPLINFLSKQFEYLGINLGVVANNLNNAKQNIIVANNTDNSSTSPVVMNNATNSTATDSISYINKISEYRAMYRTS